MGQLKPLVDCESSQSEKLTGTKGTEKRATKNVQLVFNIAAKRVVKRRCAFYHPRQTCLAPNQVADKFESGW